MQTILLLFFITLFLGCGADTPKEESTNIFDASSPAINSGSWYKPDINSSWQWQLKGDINSSYSVDIYDIDLFDANKSFIDSLHKDGKKVICYFSAGSYENWRSDKEAFALEVLGNTLDGWPDERWLDISNEKIAPVMRARLDLAKEKQCDGVEPDNMDGYTNSNGFALSAQEQLAYNKFIANEAHKRGLSVGLKNDLNQIIELEKYFDFSVNEQCHEFNECDKLQAFIDAKKPVFNAEYLNVYVNNTNNKRDDLCTQAQISKFQTLVLPLYLDDSFRYSCD